jgi:hypothetical protein
MKHGLAMDIERVDFSAIEAFSARSERWLIDRDGVRLHRSRHVPDSGLSFGTAERCNLSFLKK